MLPTFTIPQGHAWRRILLFSGVFDADAYVGCSVLLSSLRHFRGIQTLASSLLVLLLPSKYGLKLIADAEVVRSRLASLCSATAPTSARKCMSCASCMLKPKTDTPSLSYIHRAPVSLLLESQVCGRLGGSSCWCDHGLLAARCAIRLPH